MPNFFYSLFIEAVHVLICIYGVCCVNTLSCNDIKQLCLINNYMLRYGLKLCYFLINVFNLNCIYKYVKNVVCIHS